MLQELIDVPDILKGSIEVMLYCKNKEIGFHDFLKNFNYDIVLGQQIL